MPPKEKTKPAKRSFTDFPIMLHVDHNGVPHWINGATSYFDALSQIEQRNNYCMAGEREKEMRKEFDRLKNLPAPEPKTTRRDAVMLEKQYGNLLRNLHKFKRVSVEQLAEQFKLNISDVRTMVKEK